MKTSATIRYIGSALDEGKMDVYQASENMIAFSEFMVAAVKATYGEQAEAKAQVEGFTHGSFVTNILFEVGGAAATIFSSYTSDQLWTAVKGAFALWKHLKNGKPSSISYSGNIANVTNNNGEIIQINIASLNLVINNDKSGDAVQRFIQKPLNLEGYDSLEITSKDSCISETVTKQEATSFVKAVVEQNASDNTSRATVVLLAAVFKEGNKWRFYDGVSEFSAAILDDVFLATIENGERFGKGDLLDIDMRTIQTKTGYKITAERTVLKVHNHIVPPRQHPLI